MKDFIVDQISTNTGTLKKNVYVFINEWELENVTKNAPIVTIDWTDQPESRTVEAKKAIMAHVTDFLAELTGQNKREIVILFTDIPLKNAMLGGIVRADNPTW